MIRNIRRSILMVVTGVLYSLLTYGQENRISLSVGSPINSTNHWLVDDWEKPLGLEFKFIHYKNFFTIGGGIGYSRYDILWSRYFDSNKNIISNLNPYLLFGLNINRNIVSLVPHIDLGYSTLFTDIEIYNGGKGGLYSAVGLDCDFKITEKMHLGLGANYNMIFNKLDFKYEGAIPTDFMPTEDDTMKSLYFKINVSYKL